MDRDLKCEICNNPYDLENRSPICIPCGHTLCLICLKENYEKEGKVKCSNDNKAFNLRPEQYAKNHYILKLLQSKKTVITNININKNINLVNNNNISLNTNGSTVNANNNKININSHRSEHVNNISFLRDENRINSFNCNNSANNGSSNTNVNFSNGNLKRGNNLNFNLKMQNSNEVRVFPKNKIPEHPNESLRTIKRNNYLLKAQSIINKQENEIENIKKIGDPRVDSLGSINNKNPLTEEKELDENNEESQINNEHNLELNREKTDTARDSKRIIIKKVRKIAKKNPLIGFEEQKLLIFKNIRFHINSNFKNNYTTNNANGNCRKCGSCNDNEIHFNYNNYLNSENNLSIAYSDLSKNENKEINQELHSLKNFLNKNLGEEIITKDKIGFRNNSETRVNELKTSRRLSNENLKDSLIKNINEIENIKKLLSESKNQAKHEKDQNNESFVLIPDGEEEDSITINESDIIYINPNNYSSNVFFENINAPVDKNKISKASDKLFGISSSILDEYPNLKSIEKSELKKITNLRKTKTSDQFKNYENNENLIQNDRNKNSKNNNSNLVTKQYQKLNFHSNTLEENNAFNKMFPTITEKDERRVNTHRNSDSRQFNTSYLSNENFNFNLIESTTSKDLKKFESSVRNNDSPPIIFGYFNIIKNFLIKVNKIDLLDFYPNLDFLFPEIIIGINIIFKTLAVLLLILFNLFLFKCDFFLRFNMYLILINDTKSVIEKGEIGLIIANIKRWFAFISVVILDELIKFLYLPDLVLNAWTCLMTIYLLLISGPESGVQFIIVSIYKFLRKLNLFY